MNIEITDKALENEYLARYIALINDGKINISKSIYKQLKRIILLHDRYTYNHHEVTRRINFIEDHLRLENGDSFEIMLWQKVIISVAYGYYKEDGSRVTKELVCVVGRSSAKSVLSTMIAVCELLTGTKPNQEIKIIANTMQQAQGIIYKSIKNMFFNRNSPLLYKLYKSGTVSPLKGAITIDDDSSLLSHGSKVSVASSNDNSSDGGRETLIAVDELGAFHGNPLQTLREGLAKNKDSLMIITTTNNNVRGKAYDEELITWKKILDGDIDNDEKQVFIYEADSMEDLSSEWGWMKSNPGLGITIQPHVIEQEIELAKHSPARMNNLLAKRFNFSVNAVTAFFTKDESQPRPDKMIPLNGYYGVLSADFSLHNDLTSFTFTVNIGNEYFVDTINLLPKSRINDSKIKDDHHEIVYHDGNTNMDEEVIIEVERWITENDYKPIIFAMDPAYSQTFITFMTKRNSFPTVRETMTVNQSSFKLTESIERVKTLLRSGNIIFKSWLLSDSFINTRIKTNENNMIKLTKDRNSDKIDSVASLVDGMYAYINSDIIQQYCTENNLIRSGNNV